MKAYVYALRRNGEWEAKMTIAPEVDYAFWFGRDSHSRGAEAAWLWKEALPLGQACQVAERWVEEKKRGSKRLRWWSNDRISSHMGIGRIMKWLGWSDEADRLARVRKRSGGSPEESLEHGLIELERMIRLVELFRPGPRRTEKGDARELLERAELWRARELRDAGTAGAAAAAAERAAELLQGRALLSSEARDLLGAAGPGAAASWREAIQLAALLGRVRLCGAVAAHGGRRADARRRLRCRRCGSGEAQLRRTRCLACGRECAYCEACLTMGRSRECELLVLGIYSLSQHQLASISTASFRGPDPSAPIRDRLAKWKLSPAQLDAAGEALRFIEDGLKDHARSSKPVTASISPGLSGERPDIRNFLLWAVTGAGKTEMIFPLVDSVLSRGGKALIASPRRDVIIELDPRIRRAFPEAEVVTLYGGSEQRWERGQITLSTTHQLFRFQEAFDLVILDEVDAFPYHNDPMLKYAADKSCLPGAPRLLLSATPPRDLQRAAKRSALAHARVPVRYHQHPLPEPKLISAPSVKSMLQTGKLPAALVTAIRESLSRGAQLFVFVQKISQSEPLATLIKSKLQCPLVAATSSQDPDRATKVSSFRSTDIRILVTTTILERGVTIPKSDVFILDADGKLFDEASLVQMAGRAGRNAADPYGKVYFFAAERNQSQLRAVKHIRGMNRIARQKGFLLPTASNRRKGGNQA